MRDRKVQMSNNILDLTIGHKMYANFSCMCLRSLCYLLSLDAKAGNIFLSQNISSSSPAKSKLVPILQEGPPNLCTQQIRPRLTQEERLAYHTHKHTLCYYNPYKIHECAQSYEKSTCLVSPPMTKQNSLVPTIIEYST